MDTFFSLFNKKTLLIGCALIGATAAGAYVYTKWNEREDKESNTDLETRRAEGLEIFLTGEEENNPEGDNQEPNAARDEAASKTETSEKKTDDDKVPTKPTFGGMKRGFLL